MASSVWENIEVEGEVSVPITDVLDAVEDTDHSVIADVVDGELYLKVIKAGDNVTITHDDDSITIEASASSSSGGNPTPYIFTATANQTAFELAEVATNDTVLVTVNGFTITKLHDFTVDEADPSTVSLQQLCVGGEQVTIYAFPI